MRSWIGFGVAGNVAGHLEQAGEASDFVGVEVSDPSGPKGLFPFYVPGAAGHFLSVDPVSSDTLCFPGEGMSLQIEPEIGLWCRIEYASEKVVRLHPTHFGAHNDCTIRRPDAEKISEKKNWGRCSKGVADMRIAIDRFEPGGIMDSFRLVSYLERDGELHAYGLDTPLVGYTYFHQRLLDWLVMQMNEQVDQGPLESISTWLRRAGHPNETLISIGATRYTPFGESHYLLPGDRAIVVGYDQREIDEPGVRDALATRGLGRPDLPALKLDGASVLIQTVTEAVPTE